MCKFLVAVCDAGERYRSRFVTYLMEHYAGEFEVHAFSEPEFFLEQSEEKAFDLVILGHGFESLREEVEKRRLSLLLLEDDPCERVAEEMPYLKEEQSGTAHVFRYQSMEVILHEIQALARGKRAVSVPMTAPAGVEVIGVCSPVCHEMQMPFSMVFAVLLSERQKVLYLNLMEFSGFLELFDLAGEYDFGDVLLRLREGRLSSELFWRSVYEADGVYYIPPFSNPENLKEMDLEDFTAFLDYVDRNTDFAAIVFDFGQGLRQFSGMLERCTSVYCPVKSGFFFECQIGQFCSWLQAEGGGAVRERLHMVELPFSARRIRAETGVLKQLQWSEFGDFVRGYLTGDGNEEI